MISDPTRTNLVTSIFMLLRSFFATIEAFTVWAHFVIPCRMTNAKAISWLVTICFFISGTAGLIYQVVWSRYLALFLGHTSYAVVAVLVAFMGGLALGNACIGPAVDRTRSPLAFYACLEI